MAQFDRSLFLYGFDITADNQFINFQKASGGPVLTAIIPIGNYTCTQFLFQVSVQMQLADGSNTYNVSINRGVPSVSSNRVTIATSGSYLNILFGSGINSANSCAALLGFDPIDY